MASEDRRLSQVSRICLALPEATRENHGSHASFLIRKKVFVYFLNNHHDDGHIAVWLPVPPGEQASLLKREPNKFYLPPYVGVRGWVGIELDQIDYEELAAYLLDAWRQIAPKKPGAVARR